MHEAPAAKLFDAMLFLKLFQIAIFLYLLVQVLKPEAQEKVDFLITIFYFLLKPFCWKVLIMRKLDRIKNYACKEVAHVTRSCVILEDVLQHACALCHYLLEADLSRAVLVQQSLD
jgi:hypothetical protein